MRFARSMLTSGLVTVTGASGHAGNVLVRRLVERGCRVRAIFHRDARALDGIAVERVQADLRDPAQAARAIDGSAIVFHLAALISLDRRDAAALEETNVGGTRNVLDASAHAGVRRVIHFSSIHALSPEPAGAVVDESRAAAGDARTPPYDRSKARGEAEARAAASRGLDVVIVVPTANLGPLDFKPSDMGAFFVGLLRRTLPGLVDGAFDWVDVRDVAEGAIAACERGRAGERYLLSGHRRSLAELAALVRAHTGIAPPRMVSPMWLARLSLPFVAGWSALRKTPPLYNADSLAVLRSYKEVSRAKAERELAFRPRPVEETVADTIDWLRRSGLVERAAND